MVQSSDHDLIVALESFRRRYPAQADVVESFLALLRDTNDPFARGRTVGHFTGSAFVVSRDGMHVLLTHHRKLDRWLQLGGHADGDRELGSVALREAREESGIDALHLEPELFDIDLHEIPQRGEEPAHLHFDARYIVRAGSGEEFVVSDESHELAWWPIADLVGDPRIDASLQRMARRWLDRSGLMPATAASASVARF